jgi:hypothetical protein
MALALKKAIILAQELKNSKSITFSGPIEG